MSEIEDVLMTTDEPHFDNSETMRYYLDNHCMLDITLVDGTYAEGSNCAGDKYAIHAGGDGDSFHHRISFELIGCE